jgi:uncharacterized protein YkwD
MNMGGDCEKGAVEQWKKSPGHRKNILADHNICAVSKCSGGRENYFC